MTHALLLLSGITEALAHRPLVALPLLFGAGVLVSWTPCIYPMIPITVGILGGGARSNVPRRRVVGLTLTWVAATRSAVLGFIYLFVFSLGLTAVLAVVGVFSGTLATLPKPGPWMVWIKRAAGVVLLLTAEYYFVRVGRVL